MSDLTIKYNKQKVEESISLLSEIRGDLADADDMLYNAVMKISNAKGFEMVEDDDTAIDIRMPEKLIIQCRETAKSTINTLNDLSYSIESYSNGGTSDSGENTSRTSPQTNPPETTPETVPQTDAPIVGREESSTPPIALYGPGPGSEDGNIPVVLYGPGPGSSPETIPVMLYGPGPSPEEIYTSPPETIPVMLYGPGPSPEEIYTSPPETIPVMLYGPGPAEDTIQQNRIYNPIGGQGSSEETSSYTPSPVPETSPNVEYSSIPDTAVGMEMDYKDFMGPAAAGLGTGIASLIGANQIRKKKELEEQDKEQEDDDIELLDDNKK